MEPDMDHSEPLKFSGKGEKFVNNFDEPDDDEDTSDTENEDEGRLNDNRSDERQTDVQNVPVPEHTPEQFIRVLHNEIKEQKNINSDLLQKLKSVHEEQENQIKTRDEKIEKLKMNVDELTRNVKQKESYLLGKEDEMKRLEKQCQQDRTDIAGLKKVQEEQTKEISKLQHFETVYLEHKDQIAQLECKKLETDKKLEQSENVIRQLKEEIRATGEEKQHLILSVNDLTEKNKQKDSFLRGREDEIKKLENQQATTEKLKKVQEEQAKEISRLQNFEAVHPALKDQLAHHERRKLETGKKLEQAENVIRQLREEIRATGEEKQHLILRLSKLTGAKLTLDNPNITDLSDGKRPTKVAEEFAELYDNEWTDAFEDVNIDDEQTKISFMLKLFMRAHALCKEVSVEHLNRIKTNICKLNVCVKVHSGRGVQKQLKQEEKQAVMSVSGEENSSSCAKTTNQISPREHGEPHGPSMVASPDTDIEQRETTETVTVEDFEIPDVVFDFNSLPHYERKTIMELRKFIEIRLSDKFEAIATDVIAREYCLDNNTKNTVLDYIRKCVNICWSMCRVDPPVSISFPDVHGDMKLDTSAYKPYTKSGRLLDFIVWPALYLHEGGPLLSKGVAQGRN